MDEKLLTLLRDILKEPEGGFLESTVLAETGASSLDIFKLASAVEDAYALDGDGTIPDDEIYNAQHRVIVLSTVGDLAAYIARRIACPA